VGALRDEQQRRQLLPSRHRARIAIVRPPRCRRLRSWRSSRQPRGATDAPYVAKALIARARDDFSKRSCERHHFHLGLVRHEPAAWGRTGRKTKSNKLLDQALTLQIVEKWAARISRHNHGAT
jgi:hypothetical protein